MHSFAPIRFAAVASIVLSASLSAQSPQAAPHASTQVSSTLPATPPTAAAPPLTPSQRPPTRAQITYTGGTLSVSANNSSLNQILRQIASDTRMKIIGGVADERVFGQYGTCHSGQASPRYSTAPAATCSSCIATATHLPSSSSPRVRADQRLQIQTPRPSITGQSPRKLRPPRPINPNPHRPPTFHPSLLHPLQLHPTGPHRPMAPSLTPLTESRPRSRSTSSSSACASSNSNPPSLNKLFFAQKKRGSRTGLPPVKLGKSSS